MRLPFFSRFLPTSSAAAAAPIALVPPPAAVAPPAVEPTAEMAAQLATVTAERDQLQAAFDAFKAAAQAKEMEMSAEMDRLHDLSVETSLKLTALTSELEALRAEHSRSREEITAEIRGRELATLAASQGIPAAELPPVTGEAAPQSKQEKLDAISAKLSAPDLKPTERAALQREMLAIFRQPEAKPALPPAA